MWREKEFSVLLAFVLSVVCAFIYSSGGEVQDALDDWWGLLAASIVFVFIIVLYARDHFEMVLVYTAFYALVVRANLSSTILRQEKGKRRRVAGEAVEDEA